MKTFVYFQGYMDLFLKKRFTGLIKLIFMLVFLEGAQFMARLRMPIACHVAKWFYDYFTMNSVCNKTHIFWGVEWSEVEKDVIACSSVYTTTCHLLPSAYIPYM